MTSYAQILDPLGEPRVDQVLRDDGVNILTGYLSLGGDEPYAVPDFSDANGLAYRAWLEAGGTIGPASVDLAAYARAKSYTIRIGGTVINGVPVKTDADTLSLLNGMAALAKDDSTISFAFDTGTTTVTFSAAQAIAISTAVGKWVQGTFSKRADVLAAITAGTITTTAGVDTAFAS